MERAQHPLVSSTVRRVVVCGRSFVPLYWVYTAIPGPRRKIYQPRPGHCEIVRSEKRRENLGFGFGFGFGFYGLTSTPRPPRRNLEIPCILVFFFSFTSFEDFFLSGSRWEIVGFESRKRKERKKGEREAGKLVSYELNFLIFGSSNLILK